MSSPTTRSRTSLFLSFRESRAPPVRYSTGAAITDYGDEADDDEEENLIPQSRRHHAVDMDMPPKWSVVSFQRLWLLLTPQKGGDIAASRTHPRRDASEECAVLLLPLSPWTQTSAQSLHSRSSMQSTSCQAFLTDRRRSARLRQPPQRSQRSASNIY